MKILRLKQLKTTDIDLEFSDDEIEYVERYLKKNNPDCDYEIIEKADDPEESPANA